MAGISEGHRAHRTDLQLKQKNPDAGIDIHSDIWGASLDSGGSHLDLICV